MATIERRINKKGVERYKIRVSNGYTPDGKQIVRSITWTPSPNMTPRQVEKELTRQAFLFEETIKARKDTSRRVKFSDIANEWLSLIESTKELKTSSIERLKSCKDRVFAEFGSMYIDEISYRQIQRFVVWLSKVGSNKTKGAGLSEKTQKHFVNFMSDVFRYAIKCGLTSDNPCKNVTVVKTSSKEKTPYSLEEEVVLFDRMKQNAPDDYVTFFMLLIFTGMRRGEALGLEWKDIDFTTGICSIRRTSQYQNKSTGVYTTTPKTKGSSRCLKLQDVVLDQLKLYRRAQHQQKLLCGDQWVECDRLFTTWNGTPMHPNTPYTWLKRFCKTEGLPFRGLHSFRHAFATQAIIGGGVDVRTVSAILGHSMTSTTMNIYSHAIAQYSAMAMDEVGDLIRSEMENHLNKVPNKDPE